MVNIKPVMFILYQLRPKRWVKLNPNFFQQLYQKLGMEVWGRSVSRMLESLPDEHRPAGDLIDKARELDRHYVLTRYPNFHPEGAPMDYYTKADAERAIRYAEEIVRFCREVLLNRGC